MAELCATHRRVMVGLNDLRSRGVLDPGAYAQAAASVWADCAYRVTERDATGACVLRQP